MKWNREDLKAWSKIPTRWMDDDIYGHVNNVVYYSYFDTAVRLYWKESKECIFVE